MSRDPYISSNTLQCTFSLSLALDFLTFLVLMSHLRRICHTVGVIVPPSGILFLFMIEKLSFLIDCLIILHYLFEFLLILFLHGLMNVHFVWVWYCFEWHQWICLYLLMFWEHGLKAYNFSLHVVASIYFNSMLHHFHMLHFVINFCLGLRIWVDLLYFRMFLARFFCWVPSISLIWAACFGYQCTLCLVVCYWFVIDVDSNFGCVPFGFFSVPV